MNVTVFHGSPRKGNTYFATRLFMDRLSACGQVSFTEFFMPEDLPDFCTGCTLCLSGQGAVCPNAQHVSPILHALLTADALLFATPHYGACSMPGSMKNLFDHLDFLVLPVAPRREVFGKKAFVLSTGSGSAAALGPIKRTLKHWGVNRVDTLGLRMHTNLWSKMPKAKQARFEASIQQSAQRFFKAKKRRPYFSTVLFYYISRFIVRRYVGPEGYPFGYWQEQGFFDRRPF